jgi:hypothetical protein
MIRPSLCLASRLPSKYEDFEMLFFTIVATLGPFNTVITPTNLVNSWPKSFKVILSYLSDLTPMWYNRIVVFQLTLSSIIFQFFVQKTFGAFRPTPKLNLTTPPCSWAPQVSSSGRFIKHRFSWKFLFQLAHCFFSK